MDEDEFNKYVSVYMTLSRTPLVSGAWVQYFYGCAVVHTQSNMQTQQ